MPEGLILGAVPPREDCRDAFISPAMPRLAEIPAGGRVGTGSLRRRVQIAAPPARPGSGALRGNVDTRLRKLETDGAGCHHPGRRGAQAPGVGPYLPGLSCSTDMLPAVGQGALGLEVREDDQEMLDLLEPLNHPPTQVAVTAERAFLARLEGGCLVPVAALGRVEERLPVLWKP
jgi:hydroxymethylbilane synthase